ncbi:MAG TPA: acetyl-CoA acetyltransferase [Acidimicrobiia bacterium]
MTDPRAPVIVGVGQTQQRTDDPTTAREPIAMLADATVAATEDASARVSVLDAVDTVAVVQMVSWHYPDPGSLLARRLGCAGVRRTVMSTTGGNSPQMLVNVLAADVAAGRSDVVLLGGAECVHTRWRARREPKAWLDWTQDDAPPCAEVVGDDRPGSSDYELAHLASAPTTVYPLLETAIRATAGRGIDAHQQAVSELWATFAAVAAANPHAWSRQAWSPADIRTVSPDNRMVTFPYTKRMCANIDVDQAAAVVLCSHETAVRLGIDPARMVFVHAGADAHDHYFFTTRERLDASPAIGIAARAALGACGLGIDDVARFDLYSCFPAAVEIAMDALGLRGPSGGDDRPLTVTGGLGFAGGPANNYPTHAIARMVEACRADPGSVGLVHALGWYATKHSIGVYGTEPPVDGFTRVPPEVTQAEVDATAPRAVAGAFAGDATVEATSVLVERDGTPSVAVLSLLAGDGRRLLANTRDRDAMTAMTVDTWEGTTVHTTTDGTVNTVVT